MITELLSLFADFITLSDPLFAIKNFLLNLTFDEMLHSVTPHLALHFLLIPHIWTQDISG